MSRMAQFRLSIGAILIVMLGFAWIPQAVSASEGEPQDGPSGPTASQYGPGNGYDDGYSGDRNSDYNNDYGNDYGGGYNDERSSDYNNERDGGYSDEYNGGYNNERDGGYNGVNSRSGVCSSIHTVGLGENLSRIAEQYGVSVDDLASENHLDDTNLIYENQALCIPIYGSGPSSGSRNDGYNSPDRSGGYDNQDNGYGNQGGYGRPGESYDPSLRYGDQSNGYGEQSNGYGEQSNRYGDQGNSYGNQSNSYGDRDNGDELQPGQSRWSSD
ncbi:MAG: LysM peptidoglycan-binding domain-containing protein [Caldilineaceae bacterium]|nr:LysM peptidoglycan-binding domain-containing protein [Caldilineaceae bacterium]